MSTNKKAWINLIFFVITLAVNALGATGVINGLTQKEISDQFVTLITPSPSTFSIWSVIYILLLLSIVMMVARKNDPYYTKAVEEITPLFIISCLLNIAWIVTFSFVLVEISVLFILAFFIALVLICLKLLKINDGKHWLLPVTFGMYAGWLLIASVVNIAAALVKINWNGFGISEVNWAIIILIVAILLLILIQTQIRNAIFPLPVAWAYFGIYQYLRSPEGFNGQYAQLETVAIIGAAILVLVAIASFIINRWWFLPKQKSA
ncbi:MAG: tryptophan-rich sensory protein [Anaerolineaceae bacterium]|nr:tryptophan-rich sensory protein [Anaerolineaceae bacterium]MDD4042231.1 tryptophan-rich sensory protein [Anaerolineaceae bacterium]MDD4577975.1 tryptophan-rich sensory protein [Anaerolineaceae bacterium]